MHIGDGVDFDIVDGLIELTRTRSDGGVDIVCLSPETYENIVQIVQEMLVLEPDNTGMCFTVRRPAHG